MASPSATTISPAIESLLLDSPLILPPSGGPPNFVNPPNQIAKTAGLVTLQAFLIVVGLCIRFFVGLRVKKALFVEDYIVFLSFLFFIASEVFCVLVVTQGGIGIDQWNLPLWRFEIGLYYVNIVEILNNIALFGIKFTILLQIQRVFVTNQDDVQDKIRRWMIRCGMAILVVWTIITTFLFIFSCVPRVDIWNVLATGGTCLNTMALVKGGGIFNVLFDLSLLLLPIYTVWRLQMHKKRKIHLLAIFSIGFLGCMASIARCYFSFAVAESPNVSFNLYWVGVTTNFEIVAGFTVSNVPFISIFYYYMRARKRSSAGSPEEVVSSSDSSWRNFLGLRKNGSGSRQARPSGLVRASGGDNNKSDGFYKDSSEESKEQMRSPLKRNNSNEATTPVERGGESEKQKDAVAAGSKSEICIEIDQNERYGEHFA